ncbi:hypothetical protein H072_7257 [Dactylellina haptotyla CBS 200.50]|uniref:Nucleoside phosphorylase domain-containing protein n=1 Tax=Dactylellina haptotyla (strain CBS 200.50) TaxID=1284197 RepID=S8ACX3_DACHA|nr:hypothetical protein H072_7257 [Dactylellina haptotyla CBS 200.50]
MKTVTRHRQKSVDDRVYDIIKEAKRANMIFKDPGQERDLLFKGGRRVNRERRRSSNNTHPKIHYSHVASGGKLIGDAETRDMIGDTPGALCIEMEAAGVTTSNDKSCLVIRGLCDYADAHKDDEWQSIAAIAAAATAKELKRLRLVKSQLQRLHNGKSIDRVFFTGGNNRLILYLKTDFYHQVVRM